MSGSTSEREADYASTAYTPASKDELRSYLPDDASPQQQQQHRQASPASRTLTWDDDDSAAALEANAAQMSSADFAMLAEQAHAEHAARAARAGGKRRKQSPPKFVAGTLFLKTSSSAKLRSIGDDGSGSGQKRLPQLQARNSRHVFAGTPLDFSPSSEGGKRNQQVDPAALAVLHAPLSAPAEYAQMSVSMPHLHAASAHKKSQSVVTSTTLLSRHDPSQFIEDPIRLREELFAARKSLSVAEKTLVHARTEIAKLQAHKKKQEKELAEVLSRKIGEGADTASGGLQLIKSERNLISGMLTKMRELEERVAVAEADRAQALRENQEQHHRLMHASKSALFFEEEAKRLMDLLAKAKAHRDLSKFLVSHHASSDEAKDEDGSQASKAVESALIDFHQSENRRLVAANKALTERLAKSAKKEAAWRNAEQEYVRNLSEGRILVQDTYKENERLRREIAESQNAVRGASAEVEALNARVLQYQRDESVYATQRSKLMRENAALTNALNIKKEQYLTLATNYRKIGGQHGIIAEDEAESSAAAGASPKSRSPARGGSIGGSGAGSSSVKASRPATAESRVVASFVDMHSHATPQKSTATASKAAPASRVAATPEPKQAAAVAEPKSGEDEDEYVDDTVAEAVPALKSSKKAAAAKPMTKEKTPSKSAAAAAEKESKPKAVEKQKAVAPAAAAAPKADRQASVKPAAAASGAASPDKPASAAASKPGSAKDSAATTKEPVTSSVDEKEEASPPAESKPVLTVDPSTPATPAAATPRPDEASLTVEVSAAPERPKTAVQTKPLEVIPAREPAPSNAVGCDTCMSAAVRQCVDCESPFCLDCFEDLHKGKMKGHTSHAIGAAAAEEKEVETTKDASSKPASAAAKKSDPEDSYEDDYADDDAAAAAPKAESAAASAKGGETAKDILASKRLASAGSRSNFAKDVAVPRTPAVPLCDACSFSLVEVVCKDCKPVMQCCAGCDEEVHTLPARKSHARKPFVAAAAQAESKKPAEPSAKADAIAASSSPAVVAAAAPASIVGTGAMCEVCDSIVATVFCGTCRAGWQTMCEGCDVDMHASKANAAHVRTPIVTAAADAAAPVASTDAAAAAASPAPADAAPSAAPAAAAAPSSVSDHFAEKQKERASRPSVFSATTARPSSAAAKSTPLCSNCFAVTASLRCTTGCGALCNECSTEMHIPATKRDHAIEPLAATPAPRARPPSARNTRPPSASATAKPTVVREEEEGEGVAVATIPAAAAPASAIPAAAPAVNAQLGGEGESSSEEEDD